MTGLEVKGKIACSGIDGACGRRREGWSGRESDAVTGADRKYSIVACCYHWNSSSPDA